MDLALAAEVDLDGLILLHGISMRGVFLLHGLAHRIKLNSYYNARVFLSLCDEL